jgi:RNA polymerase sigma factor (sigma-70 family)
MTTIEFNHQIASLKGSLELFTRKFTMNKMESEDLVQDTVLKALLNKDKFRMNTNLKGWLFTIMRNTFINNYRKSQQANTMLDDTKELYFLNVADDYTFNAPDRTYEYEEIVNCVHGLNDSLLTPFKMHFEGYKYHEIAIELKVPIGTVKNRIFHARKEIQQKLASK